MKAIEQGHQYQLDNMEGGFQTLLFIQKEVTPNSTEGIPMQTIMNGTTNEEVLKVLIDRMYFLQGKMASRENAIVITNLEESLMWLEKRTADRKARGVEGAFAK